MIMNDIPASAVADAAPDLESRAHSDDHFDTRLWLRLMACTNLVEGEIRSRLRTEHTTTLPRFDLMAQLQRQPAGMKMSELSRHLMVTNGNITSTETVGRGNTGNRRSIVDQKLANRAVPLNEWHHVA